MRKIVDNEAVGLTAPARAEDKAFATLRAQLALRGHTLHRTSQGDGPPRYYSERWGMVRYLHTLTDVRGFLAQIGGAE